MVHTWYFPPDSNPSKMFKTRNGVVGYVSCNQLPSLWRHWHRPWGCVRVILPQMIFYFHIQNNHPIKLFLLVSIAELLELNILTNFGIKEGKIPFNRNRQKIMKYLIWSYSHRELTCCSVNFTQFCTLNPEPKGQLIQNLIRNIEVTCRSKN